MTKRAGADGFLANSGEPHVAQKRRLTVVPESATTEKEAGEPSTTTLWALTTRAVVQEPPDEYWQSRQ